MTERIKFDLGKLQGKVLEGLGDLILKLYGVRGGEYDVDNLKLGPLNNVLPTIPQPGSWNSSLDENTPST